MDAKLIKYVKKSFSSSYNASKNVTIDFKKIQRVNQIIDNQIIDKVRFDDNVTIHIIPSIYAIGEDRNNYDLIDKFRFKQRSKEFEVLFN